MRHLKCGFENDNTYIAQLCLAQHNIGNKVCGSGGTVYWASSAASLCQTMGIIIISESYLTTFIGGIL